MSGLPQEAILFFDDISYPFPQALSEAAILSCLDGAIAYAQTGRILIVASNDRNLVQRLPPPFQREGRLADVIYFDEFPTALRSKFRADSDDNPNPKTLEHSKKKQNYYTLGFPAVRELCHFGWQDYLARQPWYAGYTVSYTSRTDNDACD
jgi:hypothetical protein